MLTFDLSRKYTKGRDDKYLEHNLALAKKECPERHWEIRACGIPDLLVIREKRK